MNDILNIFKILNYDLISKFNYYKQQFLLKLKRMILFIKLRTIDKDFLINFIAISKIFYFWLKQKVHVFLYQKEYFRGSRNSLILMIGVNVKRKGFKKMLNYFKNIIIVLAKKIDNSLTVMVKTNTFFFTFANLNYLLGLNSNKYYKYNLTLHFLLKFNERVNFRMVKNYEKIFI